MPSKQKTERNYSDEEMPDASDSDRESSATVEAVEASPPPEAKSRSGSKRDRSKAQVKADDSDGPERNARHAPKEKTRTTKSDPDQEQKRTKSRTSKHKVDDDSEDDSRTTKSKKRDSNERHEYRAHKHPEGLKYDSEDDSRRRRTTKTRMDSRERTKAVETKKSSNRRERRDITYDSDAEPAYDTDIELAPLDLSTLERESQKYMFNEKYPEETHQIKRWAEWHHSIWVSIQWTELNDGHKCKVSRLLKAPENFSKDDSGVQEVTAGRILPFKNLRDNWNYVCVGVTWAIKGTPSEKDTEILAVDEEGKYVNDEPTFGYFIMKCTRKEHPKDTRIVYYPRSEFGQFWKGDGGRKEFWNQADAFEEAYDPDYKAPVDPPIRERKKSDKSDTGFVVEDESQDEYDSESESEMDDARPQSKAKKVHWRSDNHAKRSQKKADPSEGRRRKESTP